LARQEDKRDKIWIKQELGCDVLVLSTLGAMDQPGYWPSEYILAAKLIALMLIALIIGKVLQKVFHKE